VREERGESGKSRKIFRVKTFRLQNITLPRGEIFGEGEVDNAIPRQLPSADAPKPNEIDEYQGNCYTGQENWVKRPRLFAWHLGR
jgi:hypothetical protein